MGSGPARELSADTGPLKPLPEELATRVDAALKKLDAADPEFKQRREDELYSQNVKAWGNTAKQMDGLLRTLAKVMINEHQLSLDIGSDGGGAATKPFLEETSLAFDKLVFQLVNGNEVHATYKGEAFAKGSVEQAVDYEWLERVVTQWVIIAVKQKLGA